MDTFGKRLKAERERLGLTQAAFAEACGVGKTAQYTYERGEREPDMSYMFAASGLGVDTLYVFTGDRVLAETARNKAFGRILLTVESVLGLDENRLDALVDLAVTDIAKLEDGREAEVDDKPFLDAVREWISTSSMPDQLLDLALLATIIEQVDTAKAQHPTLTSAKQGQVISTLYRAFKASGKVDNTLISSTVALAAE